MSALSDARAAYAARIASGEIQRPTSPPRMARIKAYWREHFGLADPQGGHHSELAADFKAKLASIKGTSLKAHVQETCFECVGGDDDAPKIRVKHCRCTQCPLHPVRPWQNVKSQRARRHLGLRAENIAKSKAVRS